MKTKHLFGIILAILLASCTTTDTTESFDISPTVYIDYQATVKAEKEQKIINEISNLKAPASKSSTYKNKRNDLMNIQKEMKKINSNISTLSEKDITETLSSILEHKGYSVQDNLNSRYTLTCTFNASYDKSETTSINYTLMIDILDEKNIPADFNPNVKLKKYDGKLDAPKPIDTKEFNTPNVWIINGLATGKDENEAYESMIHNITSNLNKTFYNKFSNI